MVGGDRVKVIGPVNSAQLDKVGLVKQCINEVYEVQLDDEDRPRNFKRENLVEEI